MNCGLFFINYQCKLQELLIEDLVLQLVSTILIETMFTCHTITATITLVIPIIVMWAEYCLTVALFRHNNFLFFSVRPVPRPQGVESGGGALSGVNSREALLAVAGVHIVGQRSSPLLKR